MYVLFVMGALILMTLHKTQGCYQACSANFTQKIQQLAGITDPQETVMKSCEAMAQQLVCLEDAKPNCDQNKLQLLNNILNNVRPGYTNQCSQFMVRNATSVQSPAHHSMMLCSHKAQSCFLPFNATFNTAVTNQDVVSICSLLNNFTLCLEDLIPECGQFLSQSFEMARSLQSQFSLQCAGTTNTQCVNDTLDCYTEFNSTFTPASMQYELVTMCRSMEDYTACLNTVNEGAECKQYTQHALNGIVSLKRQYVSYCSTDGGIHAQRCVDSYQLCYNTFNVSYFPAIQSADMESVCSAVQSYSKCVQPLYTDCWQQMSRALDSVRIMKEQFALQCDKEFQRLSSCSPLSTCVQNFAIGLNGTAAVASAANSAIPDVSNSLCKQLSSYFPCVEDALAQCSILPDDTTVDFSKLGTLIGAYCKDLMGNQLVLGCPDYIHCTSNIILVSDADPSAMFDADTWCAYVDKSFSCVDLAFKAQHCALSSDASISTHLMNQRVTKRNICNTAPATPGRANEVPEVDQGNNKHGSKAEHEGTESSSNRMLPEVTSLAAVVVAALFGVMHVL